MHLKTQERTGGNRPGTDFHLFPENQHGFHYAVGADTSLPNQHGQVHRGRRQTVLSFHLGKCNLRKF